MTLWIKTFKRDRGNKSGVNASAVKTSVTAHTLYASLLVASQTNTFSLVSSLMNALFLSLRGDPVYAE